MIRVVDASVVVKWYVPENHSPEAARLLDTKYELHAPELISVEFGNIVWKKARRSEITESEVQRMTKAFLNVDVELHRHKTLLPAATTGAILSGQTVYDWSYLTLAVALGCEFVTADEKFYRALEKTKLKRHLLWVADVL